LLEAIGASLTHDETCYAKSSFRYLEDAGAVNENLMEDPVAGRPRIVRRSPVARTPKLCPKCLSPVTKGSRLGGWLIPQDYYCEKCGYSGYAYLEPDKEKPTEEEKAG